MFYFLLQMLISLQTKAMATAAAQEEAAILESQRAADQRLTGAPIQQQQQLFPAQQLLQQLFPQQLLQQLIGHQRQSALHQQAVSWSSELLKCEN